MSFTRTDGGLSNLHIFKNVDLVVFVEGGETSFTPTEIEEGFYNERSIDMAFWKAMFRKYKFPRAVHFRALGSKTAILPIAERIMEKRISNVAVAMDKDLDCILKQIQLHSNILYTYGYSWESDVWRDQLITHYLKTIYYGNEPPAEVAEQITVSTKKFMKKARRLARADLVCRANGASGFEKDSGEQFVDRSSYPPKFNRHRALEVIKSKNIEKFDPMFLDEAVVVDPLRHCYGKLISSFGYWLLRLSAEKSGLKFGMTKELASLHMIASLGGFDLSEHCREIEAHYSQLINDLASSA